MPMEEWVKCWSPQNTFGVSSVNSFAAKSNKIEVTGDHFSRRKKTIEKMPQYCSCGVIQVCVSVLILI